MKYSTQNNKATRKCGTINRHFATQKLAGAYRNCASLIARKEREFDLAQSTHEKKGSGP